MLSGDMSLMQEKLRVFSNKVIIDLATGYVKAYEKNGFPVFERVTPRQVEVLNGYNGTWQRTSGVSLNFHTNSKFVAMELFNDYIYSGQNKAPAYRSWAPPKVLRFSE